MVHIIRLFIEIHRLSLSCLDVLKVESITIRLLYRGQALNEQICHRPKYNHDHRKFIKTNLISTYP